MKWKTWTLKSQVICQRSQKVPIFSGSVTLHLFGFIAFSVMYRRSRKDLTRLRSMTLPLRCSFPQQPILINYISVCNERRQSTSFLMTKEWFTATAQELLLIPCKALFHSRYKLRGCSSILCEIRGFFQFKTLRQRISSEDDIYELLPCFSFPRQNKSCQRLLFHSHQRSVNKIWSSFDFLSQFSGLWRSWSWNSLTSG